MTDRTRWIDVARGGGILLVVTGHVAVDQPGAAWAWLGWAVYLFHMPLFFLLSGYLFRPAGLGATVRSRARGLLLPYLAFLVALMALSVGGKAVTRGPPSGAELRDLAQLALLGGPYLIGSLGVFWFVTSLFVASLAYGALRRLGGPASAPVLAAVAGAVLLASALQALAPDLMLPWSLDTALVGLACLWAGEAVRVVGLRDRRLLAGAGAVVLACAALGQAGLPFRFDMKAGEYGPPLLGLLLALSLSVLACRLALAAEGWRAVAGGLAWVGTASLVVMFLHQIVHLNLRRLEAPVGLVLPLSILLPLAAFVVIHRSPALAAVFLGRRRGRPGEATPDQALRPGAAAAPAARP